MKKLYALRIFKIFICLVMSFFCLMPSVTAAYAESGETKEDIYRRFKEFDPFTDPEKFAEKYALIKEGNFDPEDYDYFFFNWQTIIEVGSDNVLDVTELIDVYFKDPRHSISRTLPLYNTVAKENGTHNLNHTEISGLYCDKEYTTQTKDDKLIITIGNENSYYSGFQQFRLHYTYDLGVDPLKNIDEFYYDIIGNEVDRPTFRSQFEIIFPKSFDADKIKVSYGYYCSNLDGKLTYETDGNTIKGESLYHLDSHEALSCRVELPEGYFSDAKTIYDMSSLISLGATTLMVAICAVIYLCSRSRNKYAHTLEYYPPKEINCCEAAFLKNGRLEDKRIVSLLPYLASKGYILINELTKGKGRKSRDNCGFVITELKDNRGLKVDEKMFMNGMFDKARKDLKKAADKDGTPSEGQMIYVSDETLRYEFYKTVEKIKNYAETDKTSTYRTFFVPGGTRIRAIYMTILMVLSAIGIVLPLSFDGTADIEHFSFLTFIMLSVIILGLIFIQNFLWKIIKYAISLIMAVAGIALISVDNTTIEAAQIASCTALIAALVLNILYDKVEKIRTPYGKGIYARLMGFEEFLKSADASRLTYLSKEYKDYFYSILPYAYALDITPLWEKKLRNSSIGEPPVWYETPEDESGTFDYYSLNYMINSLEKDMTYRPSNANSYTGLPEGFEI